MKEIALPKYSELLAEWLAELGYTHCFMVAGGGSMHLIDGFRKQFTCIPVVHEMTAGVAAEHFNECSEIDRAFALVTTGPGLTNIVTAITGCYVERRELLVISGQVKSTDLARPPLRQRGIQEANGIGVANSITVANALLEKPMPRSQFQALVRAAKYPHPGPVMIEICLDVQGAPVNRANLEGEPSETGDGDPTAPIELQRLKDDAKILAKALTTAKRPLILMGGLVSRTAAWQQLPTLESLGVPLMTTTSAVDRVPSGSITYAGRPGTWGGQRSSNMLIAQADVIVALGAQLDLQQTGFNWREYAPEAQLYQVYPCDAELDKGHPPLAMGINANPDAILSLLPDQIEWVDELGWGDYVRKVRTLLPELEPANTHGADYVSPFLLMQNLSRAIRPTDVLAISSSGGSFTGALQTYDVAPHQRVTTSPAFASMGYGLATAIGASLARPESRILLVEGDGGFSQNLQELALVSLRRLPIKIFVLDNSGYGSIRATQKKFFGGAYVGCDRETGLGFPDWPKLFGAYGIRARQLQQHEIEVDTLATLMNSDEPEAWIVSIDPEQSNWPAVSSRILPDGSMESNPLYNMLPPLDDQLYAEVSKYLPRSRSS